MNKAKRPPRRPMDAVAALPAQRYLHVIAQDPSVRQSGTKKGPILMAKIAVPAEDLIPGPIGYRVQVVDYDSTTRRFNGAHDLPDSLASEPPAWAKGDEKIVDIWRRESDSRRSSGSLGRIEIRSSSELSQFIILRNRSLFPLKETMLFATQPEEPTTTNRA